MIACWRRLALVGTAVVLILLPRAAIAAPVLDGSALRWPWALPFVGILLTIATGPLLYPRFWHRHYGKLTFVWSTLTLAPLAALHGTATAVGAFVHAMLAEFLSFIMLLFALYVVAGGIWVKGDLRGTPLVNGTILALGTALASVIGTTGAAMVLMRPLLRANVARLHNAHVFVFFILLVGNIGGALTPLGDPPLLVGFLHGIDFFWTAQHLWQPTGGLAAFVLATFLVVDLWFYHKDRLVSTVGETVVATPVRVSGAVNLLLIAGIVGAILLSAIWKSGIGLELYGTRLELEDIVRNGALLLIAIASLALTPNEHREANGFTWDPIIEVGILFAGIFICVIPVTAMLAAGDQGAFSWLVATVTSGGRPHDVAYFWLTGVLSAFLDNAPTYLLFFELAGGKASELMGPLAPTLAAISMGSVYMGALTYLGNAPNLMIYAIAVERGVRMPSFFGYMLWAGAALLPPLVLLTFVFIGTPW
jgi:Na+/H+ antiporter NhaD/arsenite permease-like protein